MAAAALALARATDTAAPTGPVTGHRGVAVTLAPVGRLEHAQSDSFRRCLDLVSAVPSAEITLDLHAVPTIDEESARQIVDRQASARRHGGRLTVLHARTQPREALLALAVDPADLAR